jgi:hypothetical protein
MPPAWADRASLGVVELARTSSPLRTVNPNDSPFWVHETREPGKELQWNFNRFLKAFKILAQPKTT